MTDNPNTPEQPQEPNPSDETKNTEAAIPYERFKQVNEERKQLLERLASVESEQRKQREAELAEQNKWKELADQRAAEIAEMQKYKDIAQSTMEALEKTNQARLAVIPEHMKSLVPDNYDAVQLGNWLDQNMALFNIPTKPVPPKLDGAAGAASDPSPVRLTDQERAIADAMGMSYERYAAQKDKRNQPLDTNRYGGGGST